MTDTPQDRIIDLTLPLREGMQGVAWESARTLEQDGWNARTLHLYSHAGTHMDAQVHFGAGTETIDRIPIARCMGAAWVVDVTGIAARGLIEVEHLRGVADQFAPGESLLIRSGWWKHVDNPAVYRDGLPRISGNLARWCVDRQVKLLAVEPPSIADVNDLDEVTAIHQLLLGGGVTIVEGLANTEAITRPKVFLFALPLKISGGDGCPCRAFVVEGDPSKVIATL